MTDYPNTILTEEQVAEIRGHIQANPSQFEGWALLLIASHEALRRENEYRKGQQRDFASALKAAEASLTKMRDALEEVALESEGQLSGYSSVPPKAAFTRFARYARAALQEEKETIQ